MTETAKTSDTPGGGARLGGAGTPSEGVSPRARTMPPWVEAARRGTRAAMRGPAAAPFTTVVTLVLLVAGIASSGLWSPVRDTSWFPDIADGLPGLRDGYWWTPLTAIPFGATPGVFIAFLILTPALLGWSEWRLGTARTAVVFFAGRILSVLAASGLIALGDLAPWQWAHELAAARDCGLSTALVACVAAATATLRSPWRLRVRAVLIAYVAVSFLFVARFADVAHIVAAIAVLLIA